MVSRKGKITFGKSIRYFIGETEVTEEEFNKAFPPKGIALGEEVMTQSTSAWDDFTSEAMAVHPKQVKEANERSRKHNLGVKYDRKGFAHIPDRASRKRLLKLEGFHDKKGGYGD